jgi:phage terminase small subunit
MKFCAAKWAVHIADPASEISKAGKLYGRVVEQAAHQIMNWAAVLGFSPTSRQRLGIEAEQPKPAPDSPWAFLRPRPPDPKPA